MLVLALLGAAAWGQEYSNDVLVTGLTYTLDGEDLVITADMDLSRFTPKSNEEIVLDAVLFAGRNQVVLPLARLLGRGWFFHYARDYRKKTPFRADEHAWYYKEAPRPYHYVAIVPYADWMKDAKLRIDCESGGCCGRPGRRVTGIALTGARVPQPVVEEEPQAPVYKPAFIYVLPPAETTVKERSVSGRAYVVFDSGKTDVDPAYKDNAAELDKIRATVDAVQGDPDKTITRITLCGYSSPDGPYEANARLAQERTASIKAYISALYPLDDALYVCQEVPENWEGLRSAVELSGYPDRDKMLRIIDNPSLTPDQKESRLRNNFYKQWLSLAESVFPLLRRTDYHVNYTLRSYTTAEDARRILRTNPEKLSITEFFLAAQGYEMGTREFDEVFAVAARLYPDNEAVNINAANAALSLGNLQSARIYLDRAGDGAVARYTRGVLSALAGDWEDAVMYFMSAKASGVPEATPALEVARQLLNDR